MTQKKIDEHLAALEAEIRAIKQEVLSLPIMEKIVEKMRAMLIEMYEDRRGNKEDRN